MKILKKITVFIMIIGVITFIVKTSVRATNEQRIELIQISEKYKEWEKLSDEEKRKTLQPPIFEVPFIESIKRSTYNNLLRETVSLQTKYSLKDNISINIKNQQKVGSCWAFAMSSVLETTMANKNKISGLKYSPMHMDYKTGDLFERNVGEGGSILMALAYLASGYGPVDEKDFPFESVYDEQKNPQSKSYLTDISNVDLNKIAKARTTDLKLFPNIYKSFTSNSITYKNSSSVLSSNTYSEDEVKAIRNIIKQHIKENGAVLAGFYSDMGIVASTGQIVSDYFNANTNSYYSDSSTNNSNHAVTIIGWDDNYSKTNFKNGKQPLKDGAYIVLNSWGKEFGDNGYFYVSYDDAFIEQSILGVQNIKQINTKDYDQMYEYDELGINISLPVVNDARTAYLTSGYSANVFSRKDTNKTEYLTEVGLYMLSTQGVEIYVNPSNDELSQGTLVASCTGTNALESGYHTVKLSSPVKLTGSKFVVKVKYINLEMATLPLECDLIASGLGTGSAYNLYNPATSNPGESYISNDGTKWSDLYGYKVDSITFKDTSACIKAFSTYSSNTQNPTVSVTGVTLNKSIENIKVGKTASLTATVTPSNATNKKILWSSSDETVANVKDGVVTGIKEGTSTITAITEDGGYKATCKVTVEKEQKEEKVLVTGVTLNKSNQTIKIGETFSLTATVTPSNATNRKILWSSSDETVASVKDGVVTGIKEGIATITVTTEDGGYKATCKVTVEKEEKEEQEERVLVTGVTLNKETEKIQVGESFNLVATVLPTNATNKQVKWTSSNEEVATVSSEGIIKALKQGTTVITVTTIDGSYSAKCDLTVTSKENTDDDIYKEQENEESQTEKIQAKEDNTKSNQILPFTGLKRIILLIVIIGLVLTIYYIKYKKISRYVK